MKAVHEVVHPGDVLSYLSSLNGTPFSTSWTWYRGTEDVRGEPCHRFEFLGETDLAAVGLGGPVERIRARLYCRDDLRPVAYDVVTRHAVNSAQFEPGTVVLTLPNGETQRVEVEPFEALVGESVGQLAMYLRLLDLSRVEVHEARLFSLAAVSVFRYQLRRNPDQGHGPAGSSFVSSMVEHIDVDRDGWLLRLEDERTGVVTAREPGLALPDWRDDPILTPLPTYVPAPAAGFELVDVRVAAEDVELGVSLTVPHGPGPHPGVVFIGGSGAHDRHGIAGPIDLGSHEIVDYLSEHGWLGARFDTRGAGGTPFGGGFLQLGYAEAVADAHAVVEYVRRHPATDPDRVVLVGHSQGALVAAELGGQVDYLRAVALLAAAARPVEQVLGDQIEISARWTGQTAGQRERQLADLTEFVELVRSGVPWTAEHVPDRFLPYGRQRKWYADVLARDPVDVLVECGCPMLLCYGGKDFQVSAERDGRRAFQALRTAGRDIELVVFDDLDHLFKPITGEPHVRHYYDSSRHVDGQFLERLRRFLARHIR
jgi:pimeloyl-ACP methyl ester carboxylesterase